MMNKNQIEDKILELIESKDFNELSPSEIELVLSIITKSQFEERRNTIINYQGDFSRERLFITPDPNTLNLLQQQIRNNPKRANAFDWFISLLEIKIPVYISAPAFAVFVLIFYFVYENPSASKIQYVEKEVMVYVPKIDTVFKDRIVEVSKIERVEVVKYIDRPAESISINFNDQDRMATGTYSQEEMPQIEALDISFGNSKVNSDELGQFRTRL